MILADLMTPEPRVVSRGIPLADAAQQLRSHNIRHLPVVDDDGTLFGMLTDAAVFQHGAFLDQNRGWRAFEPAWDAYVAEDVAGSVDLALPSTATDIDALRRLATSHQDVLVVVDAKGRPIGIFTEHDALHLAMGMLSPDEVVEVVPGRPLHVAQEDELAYVCLDRMQELRIRHLMVLRGARLVGVVSLRDLVIHDVRRRPAWAVGQCRSEQVLVVGRVGEPLRDLVARMKVNRVGCVPVVDDEYQPVSIVTRHDAIATVVRRLDR